MAKHKIACISLTVERFCRNFRPTGYQGILSIFKKFSPKMAILNFRIFAKNENTKLLVSPFRTNVQKKFSPPQK